jgi:ATP-binding cassette subfamily F protein 3
LTETQARQQLGNFGLAHNLAVRPIASISAGQRVRLWLAKQMLIHGQQGGTADSKPSLLILDEISENLDMETRQSLIELLHSFQGAVFFVNFARRRLLRVV